MLPIFQSMEVTRSCMSTLCGTGSRGSWWLLHVEHLCWRSADLSRSLSSLPPLIGSGGSLSLASPYYCPVCGVIATSQANLAEHQAGRRHAKRIAYLSSDKPARSPAHSHLGALPALCSSRPLQLCLCVEDAVCSDLCLLAHQAPQLAKPWVSGSNICCDPDRICVWFCLLLFV